MNNSGKLLNSETVIDIYLGANLHISYVEDYTHTLLILEIEYYGARLDKIVQAYNIFNAGK